ncbi:MAG: hypothetical protein NTZ55_03080 [Candidatus Roizmanbacteria bacterium]|nr:hypothetical protein [Candidatus Roizmanbacteria bacterium]
MDIGILVVIVLVVLLILIEGFKKTGRWLLKISGLSLIFFIVMTFFGDTIRHLSLAIQIAIGILIAVGILYIILSRKNPSEY